MARVGPQNHGGGGFRITSPPPLLVSLNQRPFIPEIQLSYSKSSQKPPTENPKESGKTTNVPVLAT